MLRSNLYGYSDAYIHVKEAITIPNTAAQDANRINGNKKVIFKICAPFIKCICQTNNTQVDDVHDIDVVMPMHSLAEYSDIFLKVSGNLWEYYRDEPALNNHDATTDFPADNNNSVLFKFKEKIRVHTGNNGGKNVKIMVSLKDLSNFRRTLEMPLINFEISLLLTWSKNCFLVTGTIAANINNN